MLGLSLSVTAAVSLGVVLSLPLNAPLIQPLSNNTLLAFSPSIATSLAQDAWPGLPFNYTTKHKVLDGISRIERTFTSDGSPGDDVCPYIGGRGRPVAVHFVCTLGSPQVLSREQACRVLRTIWGLMVMYAPPMEIRYALIEQAGKEIAYLLLEWEH